MAAEEIVMWRYFLADKLELGDPDIFRADSVPEGSLLHKDIGLLINCLLLDQRIWNIQRVPTETDKVRALSDSSEWYEAISEISTTEGFMSLNTASRMYLG